MPKPSAEGPKTDFARRLIKVRETYGMNTRRPNLNKKEFAAALKIEAQTYRRYEIGDTEPNLSVLARIHEVTGVSLDYLVTGALISPEARDTPAAPLKAVRGQR